METRIDWRARTLWILIGLWLVLGLPMTAAANSVSLAWDQNPEPDLAGYKVYTGTSPGAYTQTLDVGRKTSYSVSGLIEGERYYFVVTAYDIYGNESDYSREISTTIVSAAAPTASSATADTGNSTTGNTSNSATADTSDSGAADDAGSAPANNTDSTSAGTSNSAPAETNDPVDHSSWSSWWNLLFGS